MNESGKKYLRHVALIGDSVKDKKHTYGFIDVYAVLKAFDVKCPARAHAIKKLLCSGLRGKGDVQQDLVEAGDAIARAIDIERARYLTLDSIDEMINRGYSFASIDKVTDASSSAAKKEKSVEGGGKAN